MIKNYIFDLYGTIVDIRTDESIRSLWQHLAFYMSLQGASYTAEELKNAYVTSIHDLINQFTELMPNIPKEHIEPEILYVFRSLYKRKDVIISEERVRDTALIFRSLSIQRFGLYPDAIHVLKTLRARGNGVYLLSNAQSAFTRSELYKLELANCFDGIVLSSDVGIKKPDKAIFEFILSKYKLTPETCLMIGNDAEADMLGAANIGMMGCYIETETSPCLRKPLPAKCTEISCLADLLKILH